MRWQLKNAQLTNYVVKERGKTFLFSCNDFLSRISIVRPLGKITRQKRNKNLVPAAGMLLKLLLFK